jgi:hypothetical protein
VTARDDKELTMRYMVWLAVMAAGVIWVESAVPRAQQAPVNPTAAAVAEFEKSVTVYLATRDNASKGLGALKPNSTPDELLAGERLLGDRIREARASARQGDVFGPGVVPVFKKTFSDYYERRSDREKRLVFDEVPDFKPKVNQVYPANMPKATFPPRLAMALPQLPDGLEYRLVGTYVILRDGKANVIVDFIPDVLPPASKPGAPK